MSCRVRGVLPVPAFCTSHHPRTFHTLQTTRSRRVVGHALRARVPFASPGPSHIGSSTSSSAAPLRKAGIVWYRNDLRVHDHEAMMKANGGCTSVLPVYCFDPREYVQRARGRYQKTGPYRAGFTIDAVEDLRGRLREMGSDLMVVVGKPEEVIPGLAKRIGATAVYCHTEVTYEETKVEDAVKRAFIEVTSSTSEFFSFWTNTLHHVDDVPGGAVRVCCSWRMTA
ncbi:MAG: deoxyribodipyrimidine photo-lyase [bacterium]